MMHLLAVLSLLLVPVAVAIPVKGQRESNNATDIFGRSIDNGVIGSNFPDPSIFFNDDGWWAFASRTPNAGIHVPVAHSADFKTWNVVQGDDGRQLDALPTIPAWASSPTADFWAPDVSHLDDGSYILYFSARLRENPSKHCVGAAKSKSVTGPYVPTSDEPLFCGPTGVIDASGYQDPADKARYVVFKYDGNTEGNGGACGNAIAPFKSTPIHLQRVEADGVTPSGPSVQILDNNGAEDTGIVEAPSIARSSKPGADGQYTYFLFFSRNCFSTKDYTVSYAVSKRGIHGPYERRGDLFGNNAAGGIFYAPGSIDVFRDGQHAVFHSGQVGQRQMNTAVLELGDDTVTWR